MKVPAWLLQGVSSELRLTNSSFARESIKIDDIWIENQFYTTSGRVGLKFHENWVIGWLSMTPNVNAVPIAKAHSSCSNVSSNRTIKRHHRFSKLVMNEGLTILIILTRFHNPVICTLARILLTIHATFVANPWFQSFLGKGRAECARQKKIHTKCELFLTISFVSKMIIDVYTKLGCYKNNHLYIIICQ